MYEYFDKNKKQKTKKDKFFLRIEHAHIVLFKTRPRDILLLINFWKQVTETKNRRFFPHLEIQRERGNKMIAACDVIEWILFFFLRTNYHYRFFFFLDDARDCVSFVRIWILSNMRDGLVSTFIYASTIRIFR